MNSDRKIGGEGIRVLRERIGSDDTSFEIFFKEHFAPLCVYCQFKFGFSTDEAKDAVQAAFLKLWQARQELQPGEILKAYLYKIVTNNCLDILKHEKVKLKYEKYLQREMAGNMVDKSFERLDLKQLSRDIDNAISELPEQMQKIFKLCKFEGLKYSEVALHLDISVKTVETQMGRALTRLRQKLVNHLTLICIISICSKIF